MNILILSSNNPYITAGVIANSLLTGLKSRGYHAKLIVKEYAKYKEDDIVCVQSKADILKFKIKNRLKKIFGKKLENDFLNNDYSIQDYDETKQYFSTEDVLKHVDFKPDVIIYLFPQRYLNIENLYELNKATKAPVFWYLMDSAALTGGCHYFWDCKNYLTGCGSCPGMKSTNPKDQSFINFKFKQKFINKTDIRLITGTTNDHNAAKASLLYRNKPIHKAFLPVNELFKPVPKKTLRKKLNIPNDKIVFFIGTNNLIHKRKGINYLLKSLKIIKDKNEGQNIFLIIAGHNFDQIEKELPFEYRYLGHFNNQEQLAEAYQAADFFICPSIQDGGPFMINQSIMCGTPVVSFNMGVAPDLVIPNETGFLAELKNEIELADRIIEAASLNSKELQEMSVNSRKLGLEKLHIETFVTNIEKIFNTTNQ